MSENHTSKIKRSQGLSVVQILVHLHFDQVILFLAHFAIKMVAHMTTQEII